MNFLLESSKQLIKTPQSILLCGVCAVKTANSGPSSAARTHGLLVPNQARYQLRYTRIFNFCHDTTANGKNKVFSVCGHSCGQSRFCAVFCNRGKSSKRRCRKALRRFASPYPGYNHGTPKAGALPTALHPVIEFSIRLVVFSQTRRDTSFAIPGYARECG